MRYFSKKKPYPASFSKVEKGAICLIGYRVDRVKTIDILFSIFRTFFNLLYQDTYFNNQQQGK